MRSMRGKPIVKQTRGTAPPVEGDVPRRGQHIRLHTLQQHGWRRNAAVRSHAHRVSPYLREFFCPTTATLLLCSRLVELLVLLVDLSNSTTRVVRPRAMIQARDLLRWRYLSVAALPSQWPHCGDRKRRQGCAATCVHAPASIPIGHAESSSCDDSLLSRTQRAHVGWLSRTKRSNCGAACTSASTQPRCCSKLEGIVNLRQVDEARATHSICVWRAPRCMRMRQSRRAHSPQKPKWTALRRFARRKCPTNMHPSRAVGVLASSKSRSVDGGRRFTWVACVHISYMIRVHIGLLHVGGDSAVEDGHTAPRCMLASTSMSGMCGGTPDTGCTENAELKSDEIPA